MGATSPFCDGPQLLQYPRSREDGGQLQEDEDQLRWADVETGVFAHSSGPLGSVLVR